MTATSVTVRFGASGAAEVGSFVRLSGSAHIQCCTYEDDPPILIIEDAPADVSITTPDRKQVSEEDIRLAHRLADAVARYVAELERLAAGTGEDNTSTDDAAGRAA
jgi:hypothetical protein